MSTDARDGLGTLLLGPPVRVRGQVALDEALGDAEETEVPTQRPSALECR